ncbi:putative phage tail protein [Nostoc linckia]|uniref:putative phage tail protein n=1 Tax=Nostoc linckia TaxID=92942 RepID=UPI000BFFC791|nr:putative phage tail protein [Nostoc linckia]
MDVSDYKQELYALLPQGLAWTREPDSTLDKLLTAFAEELARVDGRVQDYLREIYPLNAVELLTDWEAEAGLPNPCSGLGETTLIRQQQILQQVAATGGQSRAYYIETAQRLGFKITIREYDPSYADVMGADQPLIGEEWQFAWQVQAPTQSITYFEADRSGADEPLAYWGNTLLECVIERLKPAHTVVIFSYGYEWVVPEISLLPPVAVLSTRQVNSDAPAAMRVRRSSDNKQQDIGFVGRDLDTAALLAFVGAGDGFVVKWYDQSGNENHFTNIANSQQPQVVASGVLITGINGKLALRFDGVSDNLARTMTQPVPCSAFIHMKVLTLPAQRLAIAADANGPYVNQLFFDLFGSPQRSAIANSSSIAYTHSLLNRWEYHSCFWRGAGSQYYVQGELRGTANFGSTASTNRGIGGYPGATQCLNCEISEVILWNGDAGSIRQKVEENAAVYFGAS